MTARDRQWIDGLWQTVPEGGGVGAPGPPGPPGATTLAALTDVTGVAGTGKAPVSDGAGAFPLTDVATQAELDAVVAGRDYLDVRDFGATGTADDTATILAAITEADSQKRVYLPKEGAPYTFSVELLDGLLATEIYGDGPGSVVKPLSPTEPCFVLRYTSGFPAFLRHKFRGLNFTDESSKTGCGIWTNYGIDVGGCQFTDLKYGIVGQSAEWSRVKLSYFQQCQFGTFATVADGSTTNDPVGITNTLVSNPSEWSFEDCWFNFCDTSYYEDQPDNIWDQTTTLMFDNVQIIGGKTGIVVIGGYGGVLLRKVWFEGRSGLETGVTVNGNVIPSSIIYTEGASVTLNQVFGLASANPIIVKHANTARLTTSAIVLPPRLSIRESEVLVGHAISTDDGVISTFEDASAYTNGGTDLTMFTIVKRVSSQRADAGVIFPASPWPLQQVRGSAAGPFDNLWPKGSCAGSVTNAYGTPTLEIMDGDGFVGNRYLKVTDCDVGHGVTAGEFVSVTDAVYVLTFAIRQTTGATRQFRISPQGASNSPSLIGYFNVPDGSKWQHYAAITGCLAGGAGAQVVLTNESGATRDFDLSAIQLLAFTSVADAMQYLDTGVYTLTPNYRGEVTGDNPLLYWRTGELAGLTAADASGNGRTGTYSGTGVTYGVLGAVINDNDTAVTLDGIAGCLQSAATLDLSAYSAITIEMWLKATFADDMGLLMETSANYNSNNGAFQINPGSTGNVWGLAVQEGGLYNEVSIPPPADGVWHHVAIVLRTGIAGIGGFTIRIDKVDQPPAGSQDNAITAFGNYTVNVGSRNAASNFMACSVDEIAIYGYEVPNVRLDAHYDATLEPR